MPRRRRVEKWRELQSYIITNTNQNKASRFTSNSAIVTNKCSSKMSKNTEFKNPKLDHWATSDASADSTLFRDFNLAWEYYKINLEERKEITRRIFLFSALPYTVAVSAITVLKEYGTILNTTLVTIALTCIATIAWSYSFTQLIALAKEEAVSQDYLRFLNQVRSYIGQRSPQFRPFLKYRSFEKQTQLSLNHFQASGEWPTFCLTAEIKEEKKETLFAYFTKARFWREAGTILLVACQFSVALILITLLAIPTELYPPNEPDGIIIQFFLVTFLAFTIQLEIFRRLATEKK